jgi:hypothetical protein
MNAAKPFGDLETAIILVIGHDPRLQHSQAEAEFAFFLDYLTRPPPRLTAEACKFGLAQAVMEYVSDLAGRDVALAELYATNLCNQFIPRPGSGTVLIPDTLARQGVEQIEEAVVGGRFKVILPMAVQTFYHLCRLGFLDEHSDLLARFVAGARPRRSKAAQGLYVQSGKAPFLAVCGELFHHRGVPVVPIVHVKQWPLGKRMVKYREPMERAKGHVRAALCP